MAKRLLNYNSKLIHESVIEINISITSVAGLIPISSKLSLQLGLVLSSADDRVLSYDEMEIVEVVSDQVAALSYATVLDESHTMREKSRIEKLCAAAG
ncbi:hypothetical protein KY285_007240 [Solanum tuberosum]|nr:hypothetical protein KY284_007364 [Solanum tuberosum]KAH0745583.1 hypothetical protein KY285_007240 [Solanum tuberosum]